MLKQCPFCGNKDVTLMVHRGKDGWRERYYVLCAYDDGGCGASGQWSHYADEAIDAWNRRTNGEQTVDDLISRATATAWFFRPYSNEESYSNIDVREALKAIPAVDAIPVEWLKGKKVVLPIEQGILINWLIREWQKEQEAQDG